jgi:hypothetical protein
MPANQNPRVVELLSWHGHAKGGVHVPFQQASNPIGRTIETSLVQRLRRLATDIAANAASFPRWIFLVGGPGNGKSQTVQDFLEHLDDALSLGGALTAALATRFLPTGLVPRKVEILPRDLGNAGPRFAAKVGRLMVVQDATATETAPGNAANELALDLADLITTPATPPMPVFIACANRGLLARAMNEAFRTFGQSNEVTQLLAGVIQASSLGRETLEGRKPCWPIDVDSRFACWPLDVETLLVSDSPDAPFQAMLASAVDPAAWETAGRCQDCTSRNLCPFVQNAQWLRNDGTSRNLIATLRRGELARGQRWNFRDAFSLVAEFIVGQWSDFGNEVHPCQWVHQAVATSTATPPSTQSVASLVQRLYPHALFRRGPHLSAITGFLANRAVDAQAQPLTSQLLETFSANGQGESTKPIREILARDYARLDPASYTPADAGHPVRMIEEAFCQSVEQGRTAAQQPPPSPAENALLDIFERAEREWDLLGRESAAAVAAVCLLRNLAAMMAKRSAAIRLGHHALEDLLAEYEACLRDPVRLRAAGTALQPLLGNPVFKFNLLEILGQPTADDLEPLVALHGPTTGVQALAAPTGNDSTPGHDVPCIKVSDPSYRIPLTFDFFMALQLRKKGCAASSLPASVRAALDRVRHRYAGELARKEDFFIDGRSYVSITGDGKIGVSAAGAAPGLVPD